MILIVDDDKSIRLSLSVLLKRAGHEVLTADGPQAAVRLRPAASQPSTW